MPFVQLTFNEVEVASQEIIIAALIEINFDSFQQNNNQLLAFVDIINFDEAEMKAQLQLFGQKQAASNFTKNILEEENWNTKWEENFPPVIVADKILIKAPFHSIKQKYKYEIELAPKMAFGTGHHETTYMMLEQMLHIDFTNANVLDYGCGTGILAILAAMKNATTIDAIDIDDWAYKNSLENITTTGHKNINIQQGDLNLVHHNLYNVILANINKNVILKNLNALEKILLPEGHLFLSGILKDDVEEVMQATKGLFSSELIIKTKGNWAILVYKKV